ncbi:MAG TPA: selenoneine biosynthesis selenosugar synthase SenB [Burkholderiaceae bacterium]|nr:selenoneine biosynthesis selenosugar synthase SenB [Burkholderiaceae bacterium]
MSQAGGRRRATVAIITPASAAANTGNWHTAARWARWLKQRFNVRVQTTWDGAPADCLIALHARRSAPSIRAFATAFPARPCIVVLTGTDLYRDIADDAEAQRSLALATRLVVLNNEAPRRLPAALRPRTEVILQSARRLVRGKPPARTFTVAVVGHLRGVKDPELAWRVLDAWPRDVRLRIVHVGAALDEALGTRAAATTAADPRYEWDGDVPRARARQIMRNAHVLLHPSRMEGGAQAVIEAVTAGTPVIGSRIDGNVGLLGRDYRGFFAPGDADAARRLLLRAARDPAFLRRLRTQCRRRAPLFSPQREQRLVLRLVDNCLRPLTSR